MPFCEHDAHLKGNMSCADAQDDSGTQTLERRICAKRLTPGLNSAQTLPGAERELLRSGDLGASRPLR